jgi:hypothetical protein
MRGRHVGFHTQNPRNPARQRPDTTRIRVKGASLSANDEQIHKDNLFAYVQPVYTFCISTNFHT